MNTILIVALIAAGLGFILILFKLLKKAGKFAMKLPTNFLLVFAIYAMIGLSGFLLDSRIAGQPLSMGILLVLVSLSVGMVFTHGLFYKWTWCADHPLWRKALYMAGIMLCGMVAFWLSFLLIEHWGIPKSNLGKDLGLWLGLLISSLFLPFVISWAHEYWNRIPKLANTTNYFQLPLDGSPPFIEVGGASLHFQFIIPIDYRSKDVWKSKVAVPYNKTVAQVFHYKLHEHNVVKRFAKKIIYAEQNQRSKVYGWSFYRFKKRAWGYFRTKEYLNPEQQVGKVITHNEVIFAERVKSWEL